MPAGRSLCSNDRQNRVHKKRQLEHIERAGVTPRARQAPARTTCLLLKISLRVRLNNCPGSKLGLGPGLTPDSTAQVPFLTARARHALKPARGRDSGGRGVVASEQTSEP